MVFIISFFLTFALHLTFDNNVIQCYWEVLSNGQIK